MLENQISRSRLVTSTKLKLYNTCILPIFLCGSDCWAISKTDTSRIDALDQWCLRMLLGIKWYQFAGMLTRPTWHEAKAKAETRESEAEAEAKKIFRGRGRGENV